MRIRTRLLSLVLAVLVPAFLVAALGIWYVYTEAQDTYRQSLRITTHAFAIVLDKDIANREAVLKTLAASPYLDDDDLEKFHQLALRVASASNVGISLSDASGQQFLNTRIPFGTKTLPRVAAVGASRAQYGADATAVSDLYFSPTGNAHSFSVQVPVKRGERILYYLSMGVPATQLQSVIKAQQLRSGWLASIVDHSGVIVARSVDAEKFVGRRAGEQIFKKIMTSTEGFNEGPTLSGDLVVAFFSRAPNSQWTFIVSVPQSEMRRTAVRTSILMSGISLVLLGLAVVGALYVARNTAMPMEALRLAAERLGQGEPIKADLSGIAEMDAVSIEMARAGDAIRSAKADLEGRVAEAVTTAENSQRALLQGQKLEALGRLTGGIAHDFNNLLQTLTTGLSVAHLMAGDPRAKRSLESCQRAVQRAAELTRQLMAFGRVQQARIETVGLSDQIAAMMPMLKGGLRSNIDFRVEVPDGLWNVNLDPLQFELAILNLTINARDAMLDGGVLRLDMKNEEVTKAMGELAAGDYVHLSVIDSGNGMSKEVLAKALDPFFTTKKVGEGSGMGLPHAYGFAKQAGGTLFLHSTPGTGTVVSLYLPRADHETRFAKTDKHVATRAEPDTVVLFVEDDALVRDVVGPALEAAGFKVSVAHNGNEAISLLESEAHIDLVFSDIVMPGPVSGIDLADLVKKNYPHIRVLLATGYSERRVAIPGVRILAKPYDMNELVDALNNELKTAPKA